MRQPHLRAFPGTFYEHLEGAGLLSLYAARIGDLGTGDFVKVDCAACRHVALLTPETLLRVGLSPTAKGTDAPMVMSVEAAPRPRKTRRPSEYDV